MYDTFSFVEPRACGPPLSVGSIGFIFQVKVNVRSSKDGASPILSSRSGAKTNTPATYCTGPSTRHSTLVESEPTTTALRSKSWAADGQQLPCTDIDSFFVPGLVSQPTPRGLVRSQSFFFVRRNWTKKRECSTEANKDLNYIENFSSRQYGGWKERRLHLLVDGRSQWEKSHFSIFRWPSFLDRIFNE